MKIKKTGNSRLEAKLSNVTMRKMETNLTGIERELWKATSASAASSSLSTSSVMTSPTFEGGSSRGEGGWGGRKEYLFSYLMPGYWHITCYWAKCVPLYTNIYF
jgi:hypothetical protein